MAGYSYGGYLAAGLARRAPRSGSGRRAAILAGRADRITGHLDQFDALARYPQGSYMALSGAGHYLPFEQPERFRSVTLDWLARGSASWPDWPGEWPFRRKSAEEGDVIMGGR
jgi:hypothetical protein